MIDNSLVAVSFEVVRAFGLEKCVNKTAELIAKTVMESGLVNLEATTDLFVENLSAAAGDGLMEWFPEITDDEEIKYFRLAFWTSIRTTAIAKLHQGGTA
ncbi:hypothetical protein [Pleomorphomonas carboxyditropha]|uniref:Uncharacterized protein n=1 Tax=Pleomorphomonas carboxyditropha TaxID=2023338 RepID=A0A2G9WR17_9HYPH|nr:hypothetical protein [Pleomorphomonas carboxyditropha]PIO96580.1 hypothetical protein CJ014_24775 [Pleomorphomonas carboxyditropha]